MSTELKTVAGRKGKILLTQFYGGEKDGKCLQLTGPMNGYITLTPTQAYLLSLALAEWYQGEWPEEEEND
jgi:hypothetical protein